MMARHFPPASGHHSTSPGSRFFGISLQRAREGTSQRHSRAASTRSTVPAEAPTRPTLLTRTDRAIFNWITFSRVATSRYTAAAYCGRHQRNPHSASRSIPSNVRAGIVWYGWTSRPSDATRLRLVQVRPGSSQPKPGGHAALAPADGGALGPVHRLVPIHPPAPRGG